MKANCIKLFLLLLCGLLISDSIPVQAKEKSWKLIFYDDFNSIGKERFLQKRPGESPLSIPIYYKEYVRLVLNHFIKFEKQNSELLYVTPH